MLRIRLTRISNDRHRFEAVRADGSVELRELETRSYLTHDLVHFALESEGKLDEGFYGLLARGGGYEASADMWAGDTGRIEKVVAMLQTALKDEVETREFAKRASDAFHHINELAPAWLTEDLIAGAVQRFRSLQGKWRATPFGEAMDLTFSLRE
ncbi:MAG: hypothetical protein GC155_09695 [Alphaproteobacteria bacterium]|nr:hypothetical protein [Alphaproteobacteria bacterium]